MMSPRAFDLPGSAALLVAMWSGFELLVCCVGLDSSVDSNAGAVVATIVVVFCAIGLFAAWLFGATWLLIGARPIANATISMVDSSEFQALVNRDRRFRLGILFVVVSEMAVLVISTDGGPLCVRLFIAMAIPCLAWVAVYRQITGRRIAKHEPQRGASLDIRGIMLVTVVIAVASSVCRGTNKLESDTLALAVIVGAAGGLMWMSVILWMFNRRRRWFFLSLLGLFFPIGIVAQTVLTRRSFGTDLVNDAVVVSLALYVHAVVYFGILRASDYRLGLDTSPSNLR